MYHLWNKQIPQWLATLTEQNIYKKYFVVTDFAETTIPQAKDGFNTETHLGHAKFTTVLYIPRQTHSAVILLTHFFSV